MSANPAGQVDELMRLWQALQRRREQLRGSWRDPVAQRFDGLYWEQMDESLPQAFDDLRQELERLADLPDPETPS